ncbi:MAG: hypothetical protein J3K34DRAFT_527291 [Monoraphidium minutum]|nr:MAG: hypothetical protein J3K34DRAFT_527291 [Monoraphidium minutum]
MAAERALRLAAVLLAAAAAAACKTWTADVVMTYKQDGLNHTIVLTHSSGLTVRTKVSSLTIRGKYTDFNTGDKTSGSFPLKAAGGLASTPTALGECADLINPTMKNAKIGKTKVSPTNLAAKLCRPCVAKDAPRTSARDEATGACAKRSPCAGDLSGCSCGDMCVVDASDKAVCLTPEALCDPTGEYFPCKAGEKCDTSPNYGVVTCR